MTTYAAADLPDGSLVARRYSAWVKVPSETAWGNWYMTGTSTAFDDWEVDEVLTKGGKVLRVGLGEEQWFAAGGAAFCPDHHPAKES